MYVLIVTIDGVMRSWSARRAASKSATSAAKSARTAPGALAVVADDLVHAAVALGGVAAQGADCADTAVATTKARGNIGAKRRVRLLVVCKCLVQAPFDRACGMRSAMHERLESRP
jgi:hypothetical protein